MDLRTILSTPALALKAKFMIQTKLLGQFGAISQSEDQGVHWGKTTGYDRASRIRRANSLHVRRK